MANREKKRSIFARIRNYFIAGIVVLIPIGVTFYLTIFLVNISSKILKKKACVKAVKGPVIVQ